MALFKVIWTDGYNRETVAERVIQENLSYVEADAFCKALRDESTSESDWWIVQPQNAHVWGGMAEFV